ncbi:MAG: HAD family phosphatase [Ignavibacterium sp.]|nr:HAD family phosphatase [Ignavibacterium sp.]MDW8374901.1 HAD family phosphatase [Ignavibacteriales bacterium]
MREYSAVVFDLGQVILPFTYDNFINSLNQRKSGLGDEFIKKYNQNYHIHRDFERGKISEQDFIDLMLNWLDNKLTASEFCEGWSNIFSVNEKVVSLLPKLKEKYKLYLLSNTNSIHRKYGYNHYEFLREFDKIFLSYEIGYVKPEIEIYKAVEKYSGLPADRLIFIDDIPDYVNAAKSLGWDGINFTNYENLMEELKIRNII